MSQIEVEESPGRIEGERTYIIDGRRYPSVTTIIGCVLRMPELERWRGEKGNEEADRVRDEAAEFGVMIHQMCAAAVSKKLDWIGMSEAAVKTLRAYSEWFNSMVKEVISIEEVMWDEKYRYAGRPDGVVILKGDRLPSVFDIKTGYVGISGRLQTAAYRACDKRINRRLVIHLDRNELGKLRVVEFTKHGVDFAAFLNCIGLYSWIKGG